MVNFMKLNKTILLMCLGAGMGATAYNLLLTTQPDAIMAETASSVSKPDQYKQAHAHLNSQQLANQRLSLEQQLKVLKADITEIKTTLKDFAFRLESMNPALASTTILADKDQLSEIELSDIKEAEEKLKQANETQFNEQLLAVEDSFSSERLDQYWSKEKTDRVMTALESLPAEIHQGVDLKQVECRSSMCKIEAEYNDEIAQNEFEIQLPMLVGEDFPRLSVKHEQNEGFIKGTYFLQSEKI